MMIIIFTELEKLRWDNRNITAKGSLDYYDLNQHTSWFDEGSKKTCQNTAVAGSEPNTWIYSELCKTWNQQSFQEQRQGYLKEKINELEIRSKKKNIRNLCRGTSEFNKGFQLRINLVKDERNGYTADSNIFNRWKDYIYQLVNA